MCPYLPHPGTRVRDSFHPRSDDKVQNFDGGRYFYSLKRGGDLFRLVVCVSGPSEGLRLHLRVAGEREVETLRESRKQVPLDSRPTQARTEGVRSKLTSGGTVSSKRVSLKVKLCYVDTVTVLVTSPPCGRGRRFYSLTSTLCEGRSGSGGPFYTDEATWGGREGYWPRAEGERRHGKVVLDPKDFQPHLLRGSGRVSSSGEE